MSLERDFARLGAERFDLLVLGGGIVGCWTAYDAALRGLRVALVEPEDWSGFTPWALPRLVCDAVPDLAAGRFVRARREIAEERRLAHLGRHRIRPLRMLLPVRHGTGRRLRLTAGLWLYDRLAASGRGRERGGWHERRSLAQSHDLYGKQLRGGFLVRKWQTDDARLALELVDGAAGAGAVTANHARPLTLLMHCGTVRGAAVEDCETGRTVEVQAAVTIDCSDTSSISAPARPVPRAWVRDVHVVLAAPPLPDGMLLLPEADRGAIVAIPWHGRVVLEARGAAGEGAAVEGGVDTAEIATLLGRANDGFDQTLWHATNVVTAFATLRAVAGNGAEPPPGLLVTSGASLGAARGEAVRLVDRALRLLARSSRRSSTATRRLPWSPDGSARRWSGDVVRVGLEHGLDEETIEGCLERHGTRVERLLERVRSAGDLRRRIVPDLPFCMAEVVHAAADEMARSLDDMLRRRVPLEALCHLDEPTVRDVADRMGAVLGWTVERRRREVQEILERAGRAVGGGAPR
jgi:glycerol-3-phosphate dehydrogenase